MIAEAVILGNTKLHHYKVIKRYVNIRDQD